MKSRVFISLVAALTGEAFTVACGACGFVEVQFAGGVAVEEIGGMVGRLEVHGWCVALGAAEWGVDFVMTDEAIFHVWEVRLCEWTN